MGMRLIHNIHFRDKLKRIRTDQWITGIRKALWWLGLCTQAGCIYLALATAIGSGEQSKQLGQLSPQY